MKLFSTSTPSTYRLTAWAFSSALLAASFLQVLENILPRIPIFPWLKLGLSYAIVVPFLIRYGSGAAAALLVGRNALGWLIAGQAFSTFIIGTLASSVSMLLLGPIVGFAIRRQMLGFLGAGVALAVVQNLTQLASVEILFIRHSGFFFQIPAMMLWSLVSGAVTAWLGYKATPLLNELWNRPDPENIPPYLPGVEVVPEGRRKLVFAVTWIRLGAVLLLPYYRMQILMCLATCLIFLFRRLPDPSLRFQPFRPLLYAWPLLGFQAWLHLFHGEGTFLAGGWITREGLQAFLLNGLRLVNVILIGPRLAQMFPQSALWHSSSPYLKGMAMAWARFPIVMQRIRADKNRRETFLRVLRGDFSALLSVLKDENRVH